jgi:hypothetical protein
MLFTNPRQIIKNNSGQSPFQLPIMRIPKQPPIQKTEAFPAKPKEVPAVVAVTPVSADTPKPMKWGAPTWYLFHTLAEKIKEEDFTSLRKEMLDIIYSICVNLPCPICSKHATEYMKSINFNVITTKEQLKNMLLVFHNEVNQRKGVPIFTRAELDKKYSKSNTVLIIRNFMHFFQPKSYNIKLIADELQRRTFISHLNQWLTKNIHSFSL